MLEKQLKRREKEAGIGFLIMMGIYLLAIGIVLVVKVHLGSISEGFVAGTLSAAVIAACLWVFADSFYFCREFNIAVSMGQTRKQFVWCYELVSFLEILGMVVLVRGLWAVEEGIYHWLVPEAKIVFGAEEIFWRKGIWIWVLGVIAGQMLLQALLLRYGLKIYWVIGFGGILLAGIPRMISENSGIARKGREIVEWIAGAAAEFGENVWILIGVVVSLGAVGIAWMFLRRQQVVM